jgi:CRP-like cAMP-binding protein
MDGAHPLVAKFERSVALSDEERAAVAAVPFTVTKVLPGEAVAWAGDQPERSTLILRGLLSTSKAVADGALQITAFHIPGDMPDLCGLQLDVLDSDVGAITGSELALIAHGDLRRLCQEHPRLAGLLWRTTLVDAAIYREWVVNVGQRGAVARVAHLLCEMMTRMTSAGLADGDSCQLDLGPASLSDATGLPLLQVTDVLQDLEAHGLASLERGTLTVHDWETLAQAGGFQPTYLHLSSAPAGLERSTLQLDDQLL